MNPISYKEYDLLSAICIAIILFHSDNHIPTPEQRNDLSNWFNHFVWPLEWQQQITKCKHMNNILEIGLSRTFYDSQKVWPTFFVGLKTITEDYFRFLLYPMYACYFLCSKRSQAMTTSRMWTLHIIDLNDWRFYSYSFVSKIHL